MEMQIDIEKLKSERNKRAWSQTQLAEVSGLSLRTIQRIEKSGSASLESIKSLASVFELDVNKLQPQPISTKQKVKVKFAAWFSFVSIALSSIFLVSASAKPVMVDLLITSSGKTIADVQLLNEEDSFSEMMVANNIKVLLSTTIEDDNAVRIKTKIFDLSSGEQVLIASPTLLTQHRETAEIRVGELSFSLTPNI